jgi:Neocarzinostatin family
MGFRRTDRQGHSKHQLVAVVVTAGALALFGTDVAFGSATINVTPAFGLTGGTVVTVTGTGLAKNAHGNVLECNGAPGEPTVFVGPPFDEWVPVGCSPPSLKHIATTGANGSLATTVVVHGGKKLGPPCGVIPVYGGCPHFDSAGQRPRKDAQNYSCPPSPAQQAVGVTCSLVFIDTAQERVSAPITLVPRSQKS